MESRRVAMNFTEWLVDMEYLTRQDAEDDIDEMIEDFRELEQKVPRLFNLLRDISDR